MKTNEFKTFFEYGSSRKNTYAWDISGVYRGDKLCPQYTESNTPDNYNNYNITISNRKTGEEYSFEWWSEDGKIKRNFDLIQAFDEFLNDGWACISYGDFNVFCKNLGLDTKKESSRLVFDRCKTSAGELERIFKPNKEDSFNRLDLLEVLDYLLYIDE